MLKIKRSRIVFSLLLLIYSIIILFIEFYKGQTYVRNFLTDIEGPVPFYAVNTSLSVLMLSFTSLMFLISTFCLFNTKEEKSTLYFYISQVIIFAYLAIDDRFMLHERIKNNLSFDGDIIIVLLGLLEIVILLTWGKFNMQPRQNKIYLLLAALFFGAMICFDLLIPQDLLFRLSLEDLSKTWSDFFLLLFSWNILISNINFLKAELTKIKI